MSIQYISDSKGKITGVFIPISEWNTLKKKYKDIDETDIYIPQEQKDIVNERLEEYNEDPDSALDFDSAMNDIEKDL